MARAFVYIVRPRGRQKPIKIGMASNLRSRLSELQNGSPKFLEFVTAIVVANRYHARFLEQATHEAFAEYQTHGEWFMIEPREAVQFIEETARAQNIMFLKNIPLARSKRLHRSLSAQIRKAGKGSAGIF